MLYYIITLCYIRRATFQDNTWCQTSHQEGASIQKSVDQREFPNQPKLIEISNFACGTRAFDWSHREF